MQRLAAVVFAIIFSSLLARADAPLAAESRFASPDAFIQAIQNFEPSKSTTQLGFLFSAPELGQPEDPLTGTITRADRIASSVKIWSDDQNALVFAKASPPIQATRSCVGVLFLLHQYEKQWRIVDHHPFNASGKYADVDCKMTSYFGTGYTATPDAVVVTITESQGGRGLGETLSRSYRILGNRIVPAEMK